MSILAIYFKEVVYFFRPFFFIECFITECLHVVKGGECIPNEQTAGKIAFKGKKKKNLGFLGEYRIYFISFSITVGR